MKPVVHRVTIALALLLVVCLLPSSRAAAAAGKDAKRPRAVVLITVDTLREDRVTLVGDEPGLTPYLHSLAKRGVVFSTAYSTSSWTPPAVASLMTGLYPSSHGIVEGTVADGQASVSQPVLPGELVTLAELFRDAGYLTIGVAANRHLTSDLGFAQGFDRYLEDAPFQPADQVNRVARRFLKKEFGESWRTAWRERPTFLWLHYFDPHDPYDAQTPWIASLAPDFRDWGGQDPSGMVMRDLKERFKQPDDRLARRLGALYSSEVAYVDDRIRRLGEELGWDDPDVLLLFTSDHGEELLDHGELGHSQSLYEELVRIPMLVRWPAQLPGGRQLAGPVSLLDLYSTLAEILGAPVPHAQGESLFPALRGASSLDPQRPIYLHLHPPKPSLVAVRHGDAKLIWDWKAGDRRLYDLAADPEERQDRAAQDRQEARRLEKLVRDWVRSLPPSPHVARHTEDDPELREELEALGYVDGGRR